MISTLGLLEHRHAFSEPVSLHPGDASSAALKTVFERPSTSVARLYSLIWSSSPEKSFSPMYRSSCDSRGHLASAFNHTLQFGAFRLSRLGLGFQRHEQGSKRGFHPTLLVAE